MSQYKKCIVILGGGLSGTLTAVQLLRNWKNTEPIEINLVERHSQIGRGIAYGTTHPGHLLNVPACKMSAFPDEPSHFEAWAHRQDNTIETSTFVSRMLYGRYLETILQEAVTHCPAQIDFQRIQDTAISIYPDQNALGARVEFKSGQQIQANIVVLATGNYLPGNPHQNNPDFYINSSHYVADSWSSNALINLPTQASVLFLGTGLTMIDKVIELKANGHQGPIHALSRRGLLPQIHQMGLTAAPSPILDEALSIRTLFHQLRQQINHLQTEGYNWRSVLDQLRPITATLWQNLPLIEQQRFLRHLRPYWDACRHRIPPAVAEQIQTLQNIGQLHIHAGRLISCVEDPAQIQVRFQKRSTAQVTQLHVQRVINCTGAESNYRRIQDPLLQNLLFQGLILQDALNLGLEATESGCLLNATGQAQPYFYTLGSFLKGKLWESTALPEIRHQAARLARTIATQLHPEYSVSR